MKLFNPLEKLKKKIYHRWLLHCALLILKIIGIHSKDLNCTYIDNNWGQICALNNKESIASNSWNDQYNYIGLTEDQRKKIFIDFILFTTANISFIPEETFERFPNLTTVGFQDANIKILSYDWLHSLSSSFNANIRNLYLWQNSIEAIDPRTIEIFMKFDNVYLKKNLCTKTDFLKKNGDFATMEKNLKVCIENFMREHVFELETELKRVDEKNEERLRNEMSAIKEILIFIAIALISLLMLIITTLIIGCCCFRKLLAKKTEQ